MRSKDRDYNFLFKLHGKYTLSLPLKEGTTVLFSGKMLTHKQSCNALHATDDQLFFNFASCGNKKCTITLESHSFVVAFN